MHTYTRCTYKHRMHAFYISNIVIYTSIILRSCKSSLKHVYYVLNWANSNFYFTFWSENSQFKSMIGKLVRNSVINYANTETLPKLNKGRAPVVHKVGK